MKKRKNRKKIQKKPDVPWLTEKIHRFVKQFTTAFARREEIGYADYPDDVLREACRGIMFRKRRKDNQRFWRNHAHRCLKYKSAQRYLERIGIYITIDSEGVATARRGDFSIRFLSERVRRKQEAYSYEEEDEENKYWSFI